MKKIDNLPMSMGESGFATGKLQAHRDFQHKLTSIIKERKKHDNDL